MTNERTDIERIVMQRVHLIRALRFAISSGVASTLLSFFALWELGREVWVARVFENAPDDFFALFQFYIAAFGNTELLVQALIVVLALAFLYTMRELIRSLRTVFSLRRV